MIPSRNLFDNWDSQAVEDASSRDKLIDPFIRIDRLFHRLEVYIDITPTSAMTDMIVHIMVEVLSILAIATKETKLDRLGVSTLLIFAILN